MFLLLYGQNGLCLSKDAPEERKEDPSAVMVSLTTDLQIPQ